VLFHVSCGAAIGRWWAILLPALVVLVATPSTADHEIPFWFDYLIFFAAPAAFLLGLGVVFRRALRGRLLQT
jgi:hypothetical protein